MTDLGKVCAAFGPAARRGLTRPRVAVRADLCTQTHLFSFARMSVCLYIATCRQDIHLYMCRCNFVGIHIYVNARMYVDAWPIYTHGRVCVCRHTPVRYTHTHTHTHTQTHAEFYDPTLYSLQIRISRSVHISSCVSARAPVCVWAHSCPHLLRALCAAVDHSRRRLAVVQL